MKSFSHNLFEFGLFAGGHVTAGLLVWWTGTRQLLLYSLLRSYKEVEHRPETIFPFESNIVTSSVSDCGALAVVGLQSGNVAVLDLHLGLTRRVISVGQEPIWRLRFLVSKPSTCEVSVLCALYPA